MVSTLPVSPEEFSMAGSIRSSPSPASISSFRAYPYYGCSPESRNATDDQNAKLSKCERAWSANC